MNNAEKIRIAVIEISDGTTARILRGEVSEFLSILSMRGLTGRHVETKMMTRDELAEVGA